MLGRRCLPHPLELQKKLDGTPRQVRKHQAQGAPATQVSGRAGLETWPHTAKCVDRRLYLGRPRFCSDHPSCRKGKLWSPVSWDQAHSENTWARVIVLRLLQNCPFKRCTLAPVNPGVRRKFWWLGFCAFNLNSSESKFLYFVVSFLALNLPLPPPPPFF